MSEFVPSDSDKARLKQLLTMINVGGIWGTTWAIYKKIDEATLEVVKRNDLICKPDKIEENIERTKIVCQAIGMRFIDPIKK